MPSPFKTLNLALAFLLELAMLLAFLYWGWQIGDGPWRYVLAIGLPAVVAWIWSRWMAPRSPRRLQGASYLVVKTLLFAAAVAALVAAHQPTAGIVLGTLYVLNTALLAAMGQARPSV